jgi:uncharacterized surface protein with fasciclin (FAS1) repeats
MMNTNDMSYRRRDAQTWFAGASIALLVAAAAVYSLASAAHPGHDENLKNVVETADQQGDLSMFVDVIRMAGEEDTLKFRGPVTVLAPTDDAFDRIPAAAMDALLNDEDALKDFVKQHVVQGTFGVREMLDTGSIKTAAGYEFEVKLINERVLIGHSAVKPGDMECTNGTLHVVDRVLPGSVPGEEFGNE